MSDDPAWETWLRQNFTPYIMRAAQGEKRPAEAVARALDRLTGSPGALSRLAALGFILDPALKHLVVDELPRFLAHVTPTTRRDETESRGFARGRIDWSNTIARRQQTRDPLLFITSIARRSFDHPELRLLRWLLDRVLAAVESVRALAGSSSSRPEATRWADTIGDIHQATLEALRHVALRDLPAVPPDDDARRVAVNSRHAFVREVVRAVERHDRLLPLPQQSELAEVLAEHTLAPTDAPRRFELYFLMTLAAAVDRIWPTAARLETLIDPDRKDVIVWKIPGWTLGLRYDHKSPPGHYSRTLRPRLRPPRRPPPGPPTHPAKPRAEDRAPPRRQTLEQRQVPPLLRHPNARQLLRPPRRLPLPRPLRRPPDAATHRQRPGHQQPARLHRPLGLRRRRPPRAPAPHLARPRRRIRLALLLA
jgi:hypothetical protein